LNARSIDAIRSAELIVHRLLEVKTGEQVALICDPLSAFEMVYALAGVIESAGAEYTILLQPTRPVEHKNDLTPVIEKGLEAADVMIGLTGSCGAPTYSHVVKTLYDNEQLRSVSMVMRTLDNYTEGGARADYDALYADGKQLAAIWEKATSIHVTTPAGTDLSAPVTGEKVIIECGFATQPGLESGFSDGEVSQMPQVNMAQGTIVVDGPIAHIGQPDSPITLKVENGRVSGVEGDCRQADELRHIITTVPDANNIAEIGIGLNPACRKNGDFEEEKKGRGNVHVAIGDNVFYGGDVRCAVHMDMVLYQPTVQLDDKLVVKSGQVNL
jgi:leucyl aminopeptidase (aminopeptidase T)